jgi:hypothetical protein
MIFILYFVCECASYKAQWMDSIRDIFRHGYSIDARIESRNSFVNNQLINIQGLRLGLSFNRKLKVGCGFSWLKADGLNWLKTNIKKDFYETNAIGKVDTISKFLKLSYVCVYADFVFYKTKRWQLSVPIQFGMGHLWFQTGKKFALRNRNPKYFLLLYEPGITVQYKIFKWAGIGADVAYRFALQDSKKTGERLSSPSLTFKVLIWFDQLFYELFPNSEITKKYGPGRW